MQVLVAGLLPHDSGKTTVAKYVLKGLKNIGLDVAAAKPIAGHSAWYQLHSLLKSIELGVLVGNDALELHRVCQKPKAIEVLNPIDTLQIPLDVVHFTSPKMYIETLDILPNIMGVARVSTCIDESTVESRYYVVEDNLSKITPSMLNVLNILLERVSRKAKLISTVRKGKDLILILSTEGVSACDKCLDILLKNHELVIVESFNDAAAPTYLSSKADIVLIATPGKVMILPGDKYYRAFNLLLDMEAGMHPWSAWVTTSQILTLVKPITLIDIEPITPDMIERQEIPKFAEQLANYIVKNLESK